MKPKTKPYLALTPIAHDHVEYAIGDVIELDNDTAAPLLATGAVSAPPEGGGEAARLEILAGAIESIPHDDAHYTSAGVPRTDALEAASGLDGVTATERDAAWIACQRREAEAQ